MRVLFAIATAAFLLLLLAACLPPPSAEELEAYARYAAIRATDVVASQAIAVAKATEAAAAQQLAQLTAEARKPTVPPTATVTLTPSVTTTVVPTLQVAPTVALTGTAALSGAMPLPATAIITATFAPSPFPSATPSSTPTAAATATLTSTPTPTMPVTELPVATTATPAGSEPLIPVPLLPASSTITATEPIAGPTATPTATPTPAGAAVVQSKTANIREGPGTDFDVVGAVTEGVSLSVWGRNADKSWWRVCCVNGKPGWISSSLVRFDGTADEVVVSGPLLPDDLKASWAVRWECHAAGCEQGECLGESQATALRVRTVRWLETKRVATWQNSCGKPEDWLTQIDRYTGREQQATGEAPLFSIWAGANPGPENRTIDLLDRDLSLWCTATRTREVPQDKGWTVLYEGQACYDRAAGILVTMQYVKRWLFTGTYGGQSFQRQYFGDYEVYQQILTATNASLSER